VGRLAGAVRAGDADTAVEVLRAGGAGVRWLELPDALAVPGLGGLRDPLRRWVGRVAAAARRGDDQGAVAALDELRVLCAHRHGPFGVSAWNERLAGWLAATHGLDARRGWFPGQPVLVTANDPRNGLSNGDTGVVVRTGTELAVAFGPSDPPRRVPPARLAAADTTFALTIHKSQGSEYDHAVVVLPPASSPLLTRELLYTGITRARRELTVVGTEEAVRAAVGRPVARASGLRRLLWNPSGA
jgi:exodeoxyribonuclease V alpha subunit